MPRFLAPLLVALAATLAVPASALADRISYRLESFTAEQRHVVVDAPTLDWRADLSLRGKTVAKGNSAGLTFEVPLTGTWSWSGTRTFNFPGAPQIGTGSCDVTGISFELRVPWRNGSVATVEEDGYPVLGLLPEWNPPAGKYDSFVDRCYGPAEALAQCGWYGGCLGAGTATAKIKGDLMTVKVQVDNAAAYNAYAPTGTTVHTSDATAVIRRVGPGSQSAAKAKKAKKAKKRRNGARG